MEKPKKVYKPVSGYRLADVMPQELLNIGYSYRRKLKRGKIVESNNFKKGDQHYGEKQASK